jgi:uncharacterized protein (TIGR02147 family)
MEQIPGKHFREFLRNELKVRSDRNPGFSLRAFAKFIGASPSGLSMVMGGKKPVTLDFIEKVANRLELDNRELQNHQIYLLSEKSNLKGKLQDFQFIDEDTFATIKDWYHYAILNLMRTKTFKPSQSWIAKRLGISLGEVQSAVERLQNVGILKIKNGKWADTSGLFTSHTNNKKANEAARLNQIQLFEKAQNAIETVDFSKRNHTGVTIAMNTSDLVKAKEFITDFRKKFMQTFDQKKDADSVYHFGVALFPLTKD